MTRHRIQKQVDQPGIEGLAGLVALKLRAGDTLALTGDLGAGKTTFARTLIRALLDDAGAEVPSPTFSLVQTYAAPRFEVAHLDLYRIAHEDEVLELDLEGVRPAACSSSNGQNALGPFLVRVVSRFI